MGDALILFKDIAVSVLLGTKSTRRALRVKVSRPLSSSFHPTFLSPLIHPSIYPKHPIQYANICPYMSPYIHSIHFSNIHVSIQSLHYMQLSSADSPHPSPNPSSYSNQLSLQKLQPPEYLNHINFSARISRYR